MVKIRSFLLGHFLTLVLMGLVSLSFVRCTCQPGLVAPKPKMIPRLLTEITDDMIGAAQDKGYIFLAGQLRKLQKEDRTNDKVDYINNQNPEAEWQLCIARPNII